MTRLHLLVCGFIFGLIAGLLGTQALSQDRGGAKPPAGAAPAAQPTAPQQPSPEEMEKMMQAWMEAMQPREEHMRMAEAVGTYDTVTRIWMAGPDAPPTETKGTSEIKSILGGRFIQQTNIGEMSMPDMQTGAMKTVPWEGTGIFGFDNYQRMYVGCWADNMGTQLLTMRGNLSPDGNTMTMYGEMDEPMLGVRGRLVKYVTDQRDPDHIVFSIYDLHAGDDFKVVEVTYTRKK